MTYDQLKKKIQEAVPSIMAVEFGCEAIDSDGFIYTKGLKSWELQSKITSKVNAFPFDKKWKILGRPIRLADCLAVVRDKFGTRIKPEFKNALVKLVMLWSLTDDSLDNQSEETKQFLISLLV